MGMTLTRNRITFDGLAVMLHDLIGDNGYLDSEDVEIPVALFVCAIAKMAPDREQYFPLGQWATIQSLEERINEEIKRTLKARVK